MPGRVARTAAPAGAIPALAAQPGHVLCPYCAREMAALQFAPWTARTGLLSAECQCGRTVTMAAVTLRRRTTPETGEVVERQPNADVVEDFELAFARLAWVHAAGCVQLPSQREALDWHQACCDHALAALEHGTSDGGRA
jgi:hypothetical protein